MSLTHDPVLKALVLQDGLAVALSFVLLAVEVLDGLVVEQAIGVDTPNRDVAFVHLPAKLSAPSGKDNARGNCRDPNQ